MVIRIGNKQARQLWLHSHGLGAAPVGPLDVMAIIKDLGFVQLDTIRNVTRAHHHIIWSRNQNYREPMLWKLLSNRQLFEHFTHDASILPMEYYPTWRRQFQRMGAKVSKSSWFDAALGCDDYEAIKSRIKADGPLSTHAFDTKIVGEKKMWARPPHKKALDHMWYAGELATAKREKFVKFYDLAERVFPQGLPELDDQMQVDWLCDGAINRMGFANLTEIRRFWNACDVSDVKDWATRARLVQIEVQGNDGGWYSSFGAPNIEERLSALSPSTSRMRILSPFDPAIRDRVRMERLFGFEYRIEIFVPQEKRRWGYYVYPLLEGDRLIGRVELKADRKAGVMRVIKLWPEAGVKWTTARANKLTQELARLAKLAMCSDVKREDWNE